MASCIQPDRTEKILFIKVLQLCAEGLQLIGQADAPDEAERRSRVIVAEDSGAERRTILAAAAELEVVNAEAHSRSHLIGDDILEQSIDKEAAVVVNITPHLVVLVSQPAREESRARIQQKPGRLG